MTNIINQVLAVDLNNSRIFFFFFFKNLGVNFEMLVCCRHTVYIYWRHYQTFLLWSGLEFQDKRPQVPWMNLYIDWVKYLCLKKLVGPVNLSIFILIVITVESKLTCQTPRGVIIQYLMFKYMIHLSNKIDV